MTDALTNAERLLRERCDERIGQRHCGECPACAAADALAAERERRGEPVAWQVVGANGWNTAPTRDMDEATRDAAQYNGYDTSSWIDRRPFTVRPLYAAPPLPPAMGRDDLQDLKKMLARYNSDATLGEIVDRWASLTRPTPEPSEAMVVALVQKYANQWLDKDDSYWFARLAQEVGELGSSLVGDHPDTPEHELAQVASIAINWLRKRRAALAAQEGELEGAANDSPRNAGGRATTSVQSSLTPQAPSPLAAQEGT